MDNFYETLRDGVLLCMYILKKKFKQLRKMPIDKDHRRSKNIYINCICSLFLASLVNDIKEGSVKKINRTSLAFKCMENINAFLETAKILGVPAQETFQTVDLWERQNLNSVVICLQSLGRKVRFINISSVTENFMHIPLPICIYI